MNIKSYLILFAAIIISSCGSKKSGEGSDTDSTAANSDTVAIIMDEDLKAMLVKFKPSNETPYTIDSIFIAQANQYDSLEAKEVKLLSASWFDHDLVNEQSYDIETFYTIDSIKDAGGYANYIANLDLGMTKYSNVYAINQIKIDDKTLVLVWALQYSSYEACPYAHGTSIYFTVVYNGKISESFMLGEDMAAGDPPVGMTRNIYGTLEKLNGTLEFEEVSWDGNEEVTTETEKAHYKFEIAEGKIKMTSEKKDKLKVEVTKEEE